MRVSPMRRSGRGSPTLVPPETSHDPPAIGAASDHPAAATAKSVMNSRRLMDRSKAQDRARPCRDYSKDMRPTGMGAMVSWHRDNAEPPRPWVCSTTLTLIENTAGRTFCTTSAKPIRQGAAAIPCSTAPALCDATNGAAVNKAPAATATPAAFMLRVLRMRIAFFLLF